MHSIALLYPILIITAPSEHSPYFSHVSILFVTNLNLIRIACMGMDGELLTEAGVKIQSTESEILPLPLVILNCQWLLKETSSQSFHW